MTLENGFNRSDAAVVAAKYGKGATVRAKGTLTVSGLKRRLAKVVDVNGLDEAVKEWETKGLVKVIGSDLLATEYTVDELLSASSLRPLRTENIRRNFDRSAGVRSIIPRLQPTRDEGIRTPVDGKTTDVLEAVKLRLAKKINDAMVDSRLTAKTASRLVKDLGRAASQLEVAAVEARLRPYLKGA